MYVNKIINNCRFNLCDSPNFKRNNMFFNEPPFSKQKSAIFNQRYSDAIICQVKYHST